MREIKSLDEVVGDSSLDKRCIEHFFGVVLEDMEEGKEEIRVPYLGKFEKRGNGRRNTSRS